MSDQAERRGEWRPGGVRPAMWGGLALLLALPGAAMGLHAEGVVWTASDFAVMGALLGSVGLGIELVVRASPSLAWRAGAVAAVLAAFLTVWVNLAVGMIGSEDNPYNLVFVGVVFLAVAGAVLARLRAAGMAKAMAAAAAAQAAAGALGFTADARGALFSILFAGAWLLAAGLFHLAAGGGRAAV
ncbi:MAG: hypothetical protein JOZ90_16660 [Alphaproteobacteria bacterium]|nr:hypothetical protein [Alphaproteobacteria bacterium]MBV9371556.1 hypothetical protein [Alphaproteobacteria bacterium]MBV9902702.1 hypothetical protein [Alphaproteobacteria bacterium]